VLDTNKSPILSYHVDREAQRTDEQPACFRVLVTRMKPSLGYGLCVQFKSYHLHARRNTVLPSSAVFEKDLANAVLRTKTIAAFGISCLIKMGKNRKKV
jgi:hypothetical protein